MNTSSYDSVVKSAAPQKTSIFQLSKTYPAFLTLFIGLILSFFVWKFVEGTVQSDRDTAFDKATSAVMTRLDAAYDRQHQILNSFDGLYKNSVQVVRGVFELYGAIPTSTYSSILSVSYVPQVSRKDRDEFIYYAMSERYYDYKITPPGDRELYFPVEYIVPLKRNTHRSGFDFATQPQAFETMQRSQRMLGKVVASEFYNVRPDTLGFLMMFGVKKKVVDSFAVELKGDKIEGVVMLELSASGFFTTTINDNPVPTDTSIYFACYDNVNGKKQSVFTSANSSKIPQGFSPLISETKTFKIADREITIDFATVPSFGQGFQGRLPLFSLFGGVLISFVGFAFILSIVTARGRALDLAERMTRSQRRIVESSQDIIAVMDLSGSWKSLSPAIQKSLEYMEAELLSKNILDTFLYPEDNERLKTAIAAAKDDIGFTFEVQSRTKSGEMRWISWHLTVSRPDGLIYSIGRDITLQKTSEEQAMLHNKQVQLAELSALEANDFKAKFMRELSHNLRDALTGTMGFLQLLSAKAYSSEEEEETFIETAENSSEQLFTYVTDITDVAGEVIIQGDTSPSKIRYSEMKPDIEAAVNVEVTADRSIKMIYEEDGVNTAMMVNKNIFVDVVSKIFLALSGGMKTTELFIAVRANSYEKVAEVEILSSPSANIARLIQLFKQESANLIEALPQDEYDVMYNLGLASSSLRRLGGTLMIDSLGDGEQNVAMITVPLARGK